MGGQGGEGTGQNHGGGRAAQSESLGAAERPRGLSWGPTCVRRGSQQAGAALSSGGAGGPDQGRPGAGAEDSQSQTENCPNTLSTSAGQDSKGSGCF